MHIHFEWNDSYQLGHATIDEQHRHIVELANAISEMDEAAVVQHAVMELFRHTREHFRDEEELMKAVDYPGYEEHRRLHEDLIESLGRIASQPLEGRDAIRAFRLFVYKWVVEHLMEHDRQLIDHVRRHAAASTSAAT